MTDILAFKTFSLTTNERQKAEVPLTILFHFKGHHHEQSTNLHDPVLDQKKPR